MKAPEGFYNTTDTQRMLDVHFNTLKELRDHGLIIFTEDKGRFFYEQEQVSALHKKIELYPHYGSIDHLLFKLYMLRLAYLNPPDTSSRYKIESHQKRTKDKVKVLVEAEEVFTDNDLVNALGERKSIVTRWAQVGTIATFAIGNTHYMTKRYFRQIIEVFETYITPTIAAESSNLLATTIQRKIASGEVKAIRCPDGLFRISPCDVEALDSKRRLPEHEEPLLTYDEAAARIGVEVTVLKSAVHLGNVVSVGKRATARIPASEVEKWENKFNRFKLQFIWLEPILHGPNKKVKIVSAKQVVKLLNISESRLSELCHQNLLPFYSRSFSISHTTRVFPYLYIYGLRRFVTQEKVGMADMEKYAALCKEKNCIV